MSMDVTLIILYYFLYYSIQTTNESEDSRSQFSSHSNMIYSCTVVEFIIHILAGSWNNAVMYVVQINHNLGNLILADTLMKLSDLASSDWFKEKKKKLLRVQVLHYWSHVCLECAWEGETTGRNVLGGGGGVLLLSVIVEDRNPATCNLQPEKWPNWYERVSCMKKIDLPQR